MKGYRSMSRAELTSVLKCLQHNLEDIEETVSFNLMFTADHIAGSQVRKDEESLRELKEEIACVEELLARTNNK